MQGKILSPELISGDDGRRYEYHKNDVANLGNRDLNTLIGSVVDFVSLDERVAKSIYIIKENISVTSILLADGLSSARTKALWGLGLQFFNFIPYIGQIIAIVGFVLYSMAIYSVGKTAMSKTLFKNYIIAVLIGFFGVFLVFMTALIFGVSMGVLAGDEDVGIGSGVLAVLLLGVLVALIMAIYGYKIHAELATLSGSSLFLWAFWVYVISVILCLSILGIFVGVTGLIVAWVLLFIAWWRFEKLEKTV